MASRSAQNVIVEFCESLSSGADAELLMKPFVKVVSGAVVRLGMGVLSRFSAALERMLPLYDF